MENYTLQPGDFLIQKNTYNDNVTYAIFEGKKLYVSKYASPDYSLLAFYETHPWSVCDNSGKPNLEVASDAHVCSRKVYSITNSTVWDLCTEEEKQQFLDILEANNYHWDEDTWSIIDLSTGEIVSHIVKPKYEYNGKRVRLLIKSDEDAMKEVVSLLAEEVSSYGYAPSNQHIAGCPSGHGYRDWESFGDIYD